MGEKLLDELARALAEPVPRRRALQLIGAALAAVSFPGVARAAGVGWRSAADCICDGCYNCGKTLCCPGDLCAPDVDGVLKCMPCTKPWSRCGRTCCKPGTVCRDSRLGKCCPRPPWTYCSGGAGRCCGPGDKCCLKRTGGKVVSSLCCDPKMPCKNNGRCYCLDGRESCDGASCCNAPKVCRPCSGNSTYATKCCPPDVNCCSDKCCKQSDEVCALIAGKPRCCPVDRVLTTANGKDICCPAGTLPNGDFTGCCPEERPDCCQQLTQSCGSGKFCVDDQCWKI